MTAAPADLGAAVPLVGAMACRLAERLSIRVLLIKGAPATGHGVRADRPSVDVDLWVEPVGFAAYQAELEERGWRVKPGSPEGFGWDHAVTLVSADWPCTIDLHQRFPGFLTDDATAFELAWARRVGARVANVQVTVPGRVCAAAITVLHAERSAAIVETVGDRACALVAAGSFTPTELAELEHLVAATGAGEPLAALIAAAGASVPARSVVSPSLVEWRRRTHGQSRLGNGWYMALRKASWRGRPALLVAAAMPGDGDYAAVGADRTARGWLRATSYRWRRWATSLLRSAYPTSGNRPVMRGPSHPDLLD